MKLAVITYLALQRAIDLAHQHPMDRWGRTDRRDAGQTTAEYALVLLGVAAIALAVVSWVSHTNLVSRLFEIVFSALFRKITS